MKVGAYDWTYDWRISHGDNNYTNVRLLVGLLDWCEINLEDSEWTYDILPKDGVIFRFINEGDMMQARLSITIDSQQPPN